MSKEKLKDNANPVGVALLGDPHYEELTKKQNGITLIALIITIIVMLILVGVSVTVALNGGLFKKTGQAAAQTNLEKDKEILQSIALGFLGNNGEINFEKFETEYAGKTANEYTIVNEGEHVSATKGETIFYIDKYGGISEEKQRGEEYTFTLNELKQGGYTFLDDDYTGIIFDEDYLWGTVIEEDLKNYASDIITEDAKTFGIESTDGFFGNLIEAIFGETVVNAGDYVVYGEILTSGEFGFVVGIYNTDGDEWYTDNLIVESNPAEGQMTVEEFLDKYGNVRFRFVDVSTIEIPQ